MDIKGCILVVIVVLNCICLSFITASSSDLESDRFDQVGEYGTQKLHGAFLERKLIEDIERQLDDIKALERGLMSHLNLIQEKKRQLEIKKRQPVQCLVNLVSCWKRK
jgi:hypothetical protein